jgi:hypothetical protein
MHWQEAVSQSRARMAFREDQKGRVYRYGDGCSIRYGKDGKVEKVETMKTEGYMDWEPVKLS